MASFAQILGGLGDAISVGAGGKANYEEREKARGWEKAMGKYPDDPRRAMSILSGLDREAALEFGKNTDAAQAARQRNATDALRVASQNEKDADEKDRRTEEILVGLIRGANPGTYSDVRKQVEALAAKRGYSAPLNLPDVFSDTLPEQFSNRFVSPEKLAALREEQAYHNNMITMKQADNAIDRGKLIVDGIKVDNERNDKSTGRGIQQQNANTNEYRAQNPSKGGGQARPILNNGGKPPRPGRVVGATATSPSGTKWQWSGTDWIKQ